MPTSDVMPVNNEATISINWALPLTGEAQGWLFHRIRKAFERATAIIDQPQDRQDERGRLVCHEEFSMPMVSSQGLVL